MIMNRYIGGKIVQPTVKRTSSFNISFLVLLSLFFWSSLCCLIFFKLRLLITPYVSLNYSYWRDKSGTSRGGSRGRIRRPPPKIGKNKIFFTRNTPKVFAPPSARRNIFKCAPPPPSPNLKSWIRPCTSTIRKEELEDTKGVIRIHLSKKNIYIPTQPPGF